MRPFAYASPSNLATAADLLRPDAAVWTDRSIQPLAGGTDLLALLKSDIARPDTLVNIKHVTELDNRIEETPAGVRIGALATLTAVEQSPLVQASFPVLTEAISLAASPQLRNMATLGGNMLQRPRCWYFRNPHLDCWLKGGDTCPAREGENQLHALFPSDPCVAVHPSDPAPALIALNASVEVLGPGGARTFPLADLFTMPSAEHRREHTLAPDELIVAFHLPTPASGVRGTYVKAMDRAVWAFALVSVAAVIQQESGQIVDARIVLGGVSPIPHRATSAERVLIGSAPGVELFTRAAAAALDGAVPLSNNGYKMQIARALMTNALTSLTADIAQIRK